MKLWSELLCCSSFCPKLGRFKQNAKSMYVFAPPRAILFLACRCCLSCFVLGGRMALPACQVWKSGCFLPNPYRWCTASKRCMNPHKPALNNPEDSRATQKYVVITEVCCITASAVDPWSFTACFILKTWIMASLMDASIPWHQSPNVAEFLQASVSVSAPSRKAITW